MKLNEDWWAHRNHGNTQEMWWWWSFIHHKNLQVFVWVSFNKYVKVKRWDKGDIFCSFYWGYKHSTPPPHLLRSCLTGSLPHIWWLPCGMDCSMNWHIPYRQAIWRETPVPWGSALSLSTWFIFLITWSVLTGGWWARSSIDLLLLTNKGEWLNKTHAHIAYFVTHTNILSLPFNIKNTLIVVNVSFWHCCWNIKAAECEWYQL